MPSIFEVVAKTRDEHGENWGRLLKFTDSAGTTHYFAMPAELFAGNGVDLCKLLLARGVEVPAWRPEFRVQLLEYVLASNPGKMLLCSNQCGWHGRSYVLPDRTIAPENEEQVLFQSNTGEAHTFGDSGSLSDWQDNVGSACSGNPPLVFCTSAAFGALAMAFTGAQTTVFHLVGPTSTDRKSTRLNSSH